MVHASAVVLNVAYIIFPPC